MSRLNERGARNVRNVRNVREIARELADGERFEPPAGLLEKIKAEIPAEVRTGAVVPQTVSPGFGPRNRWLIAASLVAAVGAGMVGLRTWESRQDESLKVEAPRPAAPQSAAAKAVPPPPAAVPPPPPPSLRADPAIGGAPAAEIAPKPLPVPEPEMRRRDLASTDFIAEKTQPLQPAPPMEMPRSVDEPAAAPARAASPPASKPAPREASKEVDGRVEAGVVGGIAAAAPAGVESQDRDRKQESRPSPRNLASLLQAVKKDTGSYAEARRALAEGRLPDPASVRVQEWLSGFDYGDPAPAREDFAIRAEGSPPPLPRGPEVRWLRFNIKAREVNARDARVQVDFNPVVVAKHRWLGDESRGPAGERSGDELVDVGQIGSGRDVTLLYEIELRKDAPHWEQPVATLYLRYQAPGRGNAGETIHRVGFQDFAPTWEQASPALRLTTLVAELAEILKGAPGAKPADLGSVARRIQELARQLPGNPKVAELAELAGEAARIKASQGGPEK